jgi:7-cyano-7-deazaguanine synthase
MTTSPANKKAVILLSGGLDSATVVAMAKAQGYACYTMSFDYGQRHRAELQAAARVASDLGAVAHKVIGLDLDGMGGSALTDSSHRGHPGHLRTGAQYCLSIPCAGLG